VYSHFWCIFGPFWGILGRNTPKPLRLGYFAWCIPKVTAPTRHFRPKLMPPVHSLDLVLVANAPGRAYWEWVLGQLGSCGSRCGSCADVACFGSGYLDQRGGAPSPTRGVLGYFQWGISLPLGDLTCAAGGGVLWGISSGVFRCPAPGTTSHLHTAPLPY
jgi:hypothetical protein